MKDKELKNRKDRTSRKLDFAQVYIDELKKFNQLSGSIEEQAHQESFFFHLFGALEAFYQELNIIYDCQLPENNLSLGKLSKRLDENQRGETGKIYELKNDGDSWLRKAKDMRDYCTHVSHVRRTYHVGGENDGLVFLKEVSTNKNIDEHLIDLFLKWHKDMSDLLKGLRRKAYKNSKAYKKT